MTTSTATETAISSKEGDALDVFTFSGLSDEEITDLGVAPFSAPVHPTSPTPSIKFYNWDFYIQINHQSITQTNKFIHWIHQMCVINTSHGQQETDPLISYDLRKSLPGPDTQAIMRPEFVVLGSCILTSYLDTFKTLSSVVVHHQFSEEMSRHSTHVCFRSLNYLMK